MLLQDLVRSDVRFDYYRSELKDRLDLLNSQFKTVKHVSKTLDDKYGVRTIEAMSTFQRVVNEKCCVAELDARLYDTTTIHNTLVDVYDDMMCSSVKLDNYDRSHEAYELVKEIKCYLDMVKDFISSYSRHHFLVCYSKGLYSAPSDLKEIHSKIEKGVSELAVRADIYAQWMLKDEDREDLELVFVAARNLELHVRLLRSGDILPQHLRASLKRTREEAKSILKKLDGHVFINEDNLEVEFDASDIYDMLEVDPIHR